MKEIKGLKNLRESFRTGQVKYGGYATLMTLALVIGLVLVNMVMGRFTLQFDMTGEKLFSLSAQTIQVLEQIESPVNIYGLWTPGQENLDFTEVLDLYLARNRNLRYQAVDPDRNPGLLAQFDRDNQGIGRGSVIVEGPKGFRVILPHEIYDFNTVYDEPSITGIAVEHRLTSALIYVETGITPVIYEIMGHGEDMLTSLYLADMVERENYSLRQLNLIQSGIPADASALIINSPKTNISRPEADKVLDYLDRGGRLLVLADYRTQDLSMLNEILVSYGIGFDYGIVLENDTAWSLGSAYLAIPGMGDHDITKPLQDNQTPVVMPFAMGISEAAVKRRSIAITPLLSSSGSSWLRSDMEGASSAMLSSDKRGPITMAVTVVDSEPINAAVSVGAAGSENQTRIVAIGSGAILQGITNFGQIPANLDFFMNSITWLEDRPESLSVRSKNVFLMPLMMSTLQTRVFAGIFIVLIPLGFFVSGLIVWLKRRHL
jgi:ABC-type uncharacterized transport system involved in gliding motility auxiliary subunit